MLESAVATARKRWKDAEKALQQAADKPEEELQRLRDKVEQLRNRFEAAEVRLQATVANQEETSS
jgi:phage shock protein A